MSVRPEGRKIDRKEVMNRSRTGYSCRARSKKSAKSNTAHKEKLTGVHPESTRGGRIGTSPNPVKICHPQVRGSDKNRRFGLFPLKYVIALKPYHGLRESPDPARSAFPTGFRMGTNSNYINFLWGLKNKLVIGIVNVWK